MFLLSVSICFHCPQKTRARYSKTCRDCLYGPARATEAHGLRTLGKSIFCSSRGVFCLQKAYHLWKALKFHSDWGLIPYFSSVGFGFMSCEKNIVDNCSIFLLSWCAITKQPFSSLGKLLALKSTVFDIRTAAPAIFNCTYMVCTSSFNMWAFGVFILKCVC